MRIPRFLTVLTLAVLAALALSATACRSERPPIWHDEGDHRWAELRVSGRASGGLTRMAARRTGLDFVNRLSEGRALENRFLAHGSGVAIGDVDGDGLPDIYLARLEGANALYRNLGGWRFEEITDAAGVALPDRFSTGAAFADVNGNGHLDLIVTALGGPNALLLNDGTGRFRDVTVEHDFASSRGSTTIALADVDGSGWLDLYIANYKLATVRDLIPPQERAFDQVMRREGEHFAVVPRFREHYRESGVDGLGRLVRTERADADWYYVNEGGRFRAEPFTSGRFLDVDGLPYTEEPDYFALSARFQDVTGNGLPDLYVANDFSGRDLFWLNDGRGHLREAPRLALRSSSHSSMAVDFSDIDRDGHVDFFVADMLAPRTSPRRLTQTPTSTPLPKQVGEIDNRPKMQRNSLQRNRGDGTFAQIADFAAVAASEWSWGSVFVDIDLDGYEDLLIATGHMWDVMDSDTHERLATTFPTAAWRQGLAEFPALAVGNFAFRNRGDLTFEDVSERWRFGTEPDVSHAIALADLDGDGDLDVVVTRLNMPVAVYRNDAAAPRIAVRLVGAPPNTAGIGSRIRVHGYVLPVQQKEVTAGGLYLASSDTEYAFATGGADAVTIEVLWRDGARSVVRAQPNRRYEIRHPALVPGAARGAAEDAASGGSAHTAAGRPVPAEPLFEDRTAELGHRHVDEPYNDFARQPLLPIRLSQLGPGIAWYDLTGNGFEDLVIASGKGGRTGIFLNEGGRLRRSDPVLPPAAFDQTAVLGMPGGTLLIGQASYEATSLDEALGLPSVVRLTLPPGGGPTAAVAGDTSSIGALAAADIDGDGILDLFVAGRTLPAGYPLPASSRILRGRPDGTFEPDSANSRTFRGIGMVSAVLFSDLDGDGAPDLVLAMDWGPVRVFMNESGRFVEATERLGLLGLTSRWNGVATGDLDGDGRPDIIVTSWGRNTEHRPEAGQPLVLHYGDTDRDGTMDLLLAQHDPRLGTLAPLLSRGRLLAAVPTLAANARSFADYAGLGVDRLLGDAARQVRRLEAATYTHTVLLNRGTHFDAVPLPAEAQLAPAFHVAVADFDGDGHEDVFLAQNFFATEIESPRYDAGRGLLLLGDGTGALHAVDAPRSGIAIYGEQRGAAFADYDGDGRVDLVVSQNGGETRLLRNRGARPGLRVRLRGPAGNPNGTGAALRIVHADGLGPLREVQSGSGYWSQNGAIQVLGLSREPVALLVRWPGGFEQRVELAPGVRAIEVERK